MPLGNYKAFKRRKEVGSTLMLTYNLQICLAIFAFASFIVVTLLPPIWYFAITHIPTSVQEWFIMLLSLSLVQWFAFVLGGVIVLFFASMGIYAFYQLLILIKRSILGDKVEMSNLSANHLIATTPLKGESNRKEHLKAIKILMENNEKLITEHQRLLSEYQSIVKNEKKLGEKRKDGEQ